VDNLTQSQRGAVAEAAITAMVIQQGLTVLRPLREGRRYDLAVDLEPELLRVQCKLARISDSTRPGTTRHKGSMGSGLRACACH
jgi:hypothetical protein